MDSDPDPDPDWFRLHGDKLDSNPDLDHLSHMDQIRIQIRDQHGARVNTPYYRSLISYTSIKRTVL